ncbi:hypothetical protein HYFRA_00004645 [Hymenoscyphus fraxineus]|uniref:Large ribosomal subunit protein uL23m n=1 Tax=Hymenoscyphus fraxineus TaxID=746836 RepID=A0A9N9KZC1_9HELO|nr:hypothetical protein HYFRA_00004645 [Hymenoscyphus fraxineus]
MATRHITKPPRMGTKALYLPNFRIVLLNDPRLSPHFASFLVPLNLNKLDMRDYLYNCYGIAARNVRSYVQMQKVQQDKNNAKRVSPRRWHRPRSIKKMMIEMDAPFVWPKTPEDFTQWDKDFVEKKAAANQKARDAQGPGGATKPPAERKSIAEQAKELLEGKKEWRRDDNEYEDDIVEEGGEEWEEVEQNVKI